MRDLNRPQPIHAADCTCTRCEPQPAGARRRLTFEYALVGFGLAAVVAAAALEILGTIN